MDQVLFYKAQTSGTMWDTWLYEYEEVFYLFHLVGPGGQWHGIAMATSRDGVTWREHGIVLEKAEGVLWLGTGTVWEASPPAGPRRFIMNFSEWRDGGQTIFFAESQDLLHWRRLPPCCEFVPDGRWYRTGGGNDGRWDCIYTIPRPGGGRYGFWTANPLAFTGFGFGESDDGVSWRALPPPALEWGSVEPLPYIESGAVAEIDGRFYTMLGANVSYQSHATGMFTCVADHAAGPYRPAAANFSILTSPTGRCYSYFARFFPTSRGLLVNHHVIAPDGSVFLAPLKAVAVDHLGVMRLTWWSGNDRLAQHLLPAPGDPASASATVTLPYRPECGLLIQGTLLIPASDEASCPRVVFHGARRAVDLHIRIGASGRVSFEESTPAGVQRLEGIDRDLALAGTVSCTVLVMHDFVELYLAGFLIQSLTLTDAGCAALSLSGFATIAHAAVAPTTSRAVAQS